MRIEFEEIDNQDTPIGTVSLRRRTEVFLGGIEVFEIKLDDAFLMSSLFTASEEALARLGLAACAGADLTVLVGGLGLGYTAATALADARIGRLHVVEALAPVIDWHRRGVLPLGTTLADDPRCRLVAGDFFALAAAPAGFLAGAPGTRFDAILLDIDHAPDNVLDPSHAAFYTPSGLAAFAAHLAPRGVFALWSNDPPAAAFEATLAGVFDAVQAHVVAFPNPYTGDESACTVYVARRRDVPLSG